ncbi:Cd(II)/Pb(II)-responsive transcriptional regulator [Noviherbaspirillum sp. 1P10PC]|uniref:Cd(II)/Pb(II)-responsive transcriptional regulator n=1 Tax=Noviherbaspirillum sp. 1P10PC TaxID=3132292 RepID=UPI00399F4A13
MQETLKIGELAKRTDCPVETIRFYEQENLLPAPARTASNYRVYGDAHVEQLIFIRHCRALDMTLDEIRRLLHIRNAPNDNCDEVNMLLDRHIRQIAERISELQSLQKQIGKLRSMCNSFRTSKDCGILQSLATTMEVYSEKPFEQ